MLVIFHLPNLPSSVGGLANKKGLSNKYIWYTDITYLAICLQPDDIKTLSYNISILKYNYILRATLKGCN